MKFPSLLALSLASSLAMAALAHGVVFTSESAPGYCLDVNMSTKALSLWNCHGGSNQSFQFSGYGQAKVQNMCLDTSTQAEGNALVMKTCSNTPGQKWTVVQGTQQLRNEQGWCADIKGGSRNQGTPVIAWKCGTQANQKWSQGRVMSLAELNSLKLSPQQRQQLLNADRLINGAGGNIVAAGAGNVVSPGGGNIVAAGAGNIVAAGAGN